MSANLVLLKSCKVFNKKAEAVTSSVPDREK